MPNCGDEDEGAAQCMSVSVTLHTLNGRQDIWQGGWGVRVHQALATRILQEVVDHQEPTEAVSMAKPDWLRPLKACQHTPRAKAMHGKQWSLRDGKQWFPTTPQGLSPRVTKLKQSMTIHPGPSRSGMSYLKHCSR